MKEIQVKNEGKNIEIKIYGGIGEENDEYQTSLEALDKLLKENKDAALIDVYINSTGGSVFDGVAIYNMLKRNKAYKRVFIDGFACSIASVIAMAGNKIVMPSSSMMMIHNAWTVAIGNSSELRKMADDLDIINESIITAYMKKTKLDRDKIVELMDNETYLPAEQCLEMGFCTEINDSLDEEEVSKGVKAQADILQNKIDTLMHVRSAFESIDSGDAETEEAVEEEDSNETPNEVVEETEQTEQVEQVEETAEAVKEAETQNALQRFFGMED